MVVVVVVVVGLLPQLRNYAVGVHDHKWRIEIKEGYIYR